MADPWAGFKQASDRWADFVSAGPPVSADAPIDNSGAPYSVRARVGSVPEQLSPGAGPDLQAQALEKAIPGSQARRDNQNNLIYTDPKTGRVTRYNPSGLDLGDFASILPQIGEAVGGTIGAVGGGALGLPAGPAGVVAGAMGGAGAGATLGREAIERGSMALQGIPDTRGLAEQGLSALTSFGFNAAGEGAGMALGAGIRAGVRGITRGGAAGRAEINQATNDLERFGATPSVAQATKNRALDSIESLTAKFPGGAGVIRQAAEDQQAKIAAGMQAKLTNLAGIAPDELAAGGAIRAGIEDFSKNFSTQADVLYKEVGKYLKPDTMVGVSNTQRVLNDVATPIANAENLSQPLINPKLEQMLSGITDDLAKSGGTALPYQAISETRSMIGRQLGSPQLGPDAIPRADLKRVYGALSDDLRIAAQAQGPNALRAFDRASAFYNAGMTKIDSMLEPLIKNRVPEEVFAAVESTGKRGPTRLQELRNSVTPDQWRLVAATVADRLGRPNAGARGDAAEPLFSFQKFLSGYQTLRDNGSADILFNGPGMRGVKDDLDALARAADRIRVSSKAFANPPNTASTMIGGAMILGALGSALTGNMAGLGTVTAATAGSWGMAKMLTSPTVVHWLAEGTRLAPNRLGAWIGRASAIAADSDPDARAAITQFLGNMQKADPPLQYTPPGGRVN